MRIVLISHSDLTGGAAIVTYRLMKALREAGHDARMLVTHKSSDDPDVITVGSPLERKAAFLTERLGIFLNSGFSKKNLFRVSTASTGVSIADHPLVRDADAILLGWINQGTLSLKEIARLASSGKKIAWTMHDMWCMTGICHHAYGCDRYAGECGECKFLGRGKGRNDLSRRTWKRKRSFLGNLPIKYVAVSNWVKSQALKSSLLKGSDISVIHNAFDASQFGTTPSWPIAEAASRRIIAFGAANLNDPVKGLDYAIDALNLLCEKHPSTAKSCVAIFFGTVKDDRPFGRLKFPHIIYGNVRERATLQNLYANSSVVLSTSLYECLPGTLIEGMSCGAVPVTFGEGGQCDIVTHLSDGYIARYLDAADVAEGIVWALESGLDREMLHQTISDRFSSPLIASKYTTLLT